MTENMWKILIVVKAAELDTLREDYQREFGNARFICVFCGNPRCEHSADCIGERIEQLRWDIKYWIKQAVD